MKKIKIKSRKLNEAEALGKTEEPKFVKPIGEAAEQSVLGDDAAANTATSLEGTLNQIINQQIISDDYKASCPLKITLTKNIPDLIEFPQAAMTLQTLMQAAQFPPAFRNVHDSMDPNPLRTIQANATDKAIVYFTNVSVNARGADGMRSGNDLDQEFQNAARIQGNNANAGVSYDYDTELNEGELSETGMAGMAATAFSTGAKVGWFGSKCLGVASAGIGGAALGLAPAIIGLVGAGYGIGAVKYSQDHTDDSRFDNEVNGPVNRPTPSRNKDAVTAIDQYVISTMTQIQTLMKTITSNKSQEIAKLMTKLKNIMAHADEKVEVYLQSENDLEKKLESIREKSKQINTETHLTARQNADSFLKKMYDKTLITKLSADDWKNITSGDADKIDKVIKLYSPNESADYGVTGGKLNEENKSAGKDDDIIFNADEIFDYAQSMISGDISNIIEVDEKDWQPVVTAREQMKGMIDKIDGIMKNRIKILCNMDGSDQQGVSGKVSRFLSKHPIDAQKLEKIWNNHYYDLQNRMEIRIKNMMTATDYTPLGMCKNFLTVTYPNIIAMMITYRAMLKAYKNLMFKDKNNMRSIVPNRYVKDDGTRDDTALDSQRQLLRDAYKAALAGYGDKLNSGGKAVIINHDGTFEFTDAKMDLLSLFLLKGGQFEGQLTDVCMVKFLGIIADTRTMHYANVDQFVNVLMGIGAYMQREGMGDMLLTPAGIVEALSDFKEVNEYKRYEDVCAQFMHMYGSNGARFADRLDIIKYMLRANVVTDGQLITALLGAAKGNPDGSADTSTGAAHLVLTEASESAYGGNKTIESLMNKVSDTKLEQVSEQYDVTKDNIDKWKPFCDKGDEHYDPIIGTYLIYFGFFLKSSGSYVHTVSDALTVIDSNIDGIFKKGAGEQNVKAFLDALTSDDSMTILKYANSLGEGKVPTNVYQEFADYLYDKNLNGKKLSAYTSADVKSAITAVNSPTPDTKGTFTKLVNTYAKQKDRSKMIEQMKALFVCIVKDAATTFVSTDYSEYEAIFKSDVKLQIGKVYEVNEKTKKKEYEEKTLTISEFLDYFKFLMENISVAASDPDYAIILKGVANITKQINDQIENAAGIHIDMFSVSPDCLMCKYGDELKASQKDFEKFKTNVETAYNTANPRTPMTPQQKVVLMNEIGRVFIGGDNLYLRKLGCIAYAYNAASTNKDDYITNLTRGVESV